MNPLISLGYIELNEETTDEEVRSWTYMYPPMLDSCLQSGLSARDHRGAFFPVEASRARFRRQFPPDRNAPEDGLFFHMLDEMYLGISSSSVRHVWALSRKDPETGFLSMTCCDDDGNIYGSLQDVRIKYLEVGLL
jgi:hypothetical protein